MCTLPEGFSAVLAEIGQQRIRGFFEIPVYYRVTKTKLTGPQESSLQCSIALLGYERHLIYRSRYLLDMSRSLAYGFLLWYRAYSKWAYAAYAKV